MRVCQWALTQELEHKLRKTQRRMLRTIFQKGRRVAAADTSDSGTSGSDLQDSVEEDDLEPWPEYIQRVTHEIDDHLGRIGMEDWVAAYRRRVFTWAGHVSRRSDGRWSTRILDWTPEGGQRQQGSGRGRRQGTPSRRWAYWLDKYFKHSLGLDDGEWRLIAADRESWSGHLATFLAYCSSA